MYMHYKESRKIMTKTELLHSCTALLFKTGFVKNMWISARWKASVILRYFGASCNIDIVSPYCKNENFSSTVCSARKGKGKPYLSSVPSTAVPYQQLWFSFCSNLSAPNWHLLCSVDRIVVIHSRWMFYIFIGL